MSGIEVAGLVLGAFPLVVSALEHYRETSEILSTWFRYKRKYLKVKHDVEYLRFSFSQNLKELLLPLICDEEETEALMADPGGTPWSDPELEHKLKDRLAGAYVHYIRAVEEVNEIMKKWMHELGLDKDNPNTMILRTKFAFSQTVRDQLMKDFREYNGRLREILVTKDRLQSAAGTKTYAKSTAKALRLIRRRASTLYALLGRAWKCECKTLHQANLRLEDGISEKSTAKFDVVFAFSKDDHENEHPPWIRRYTRIIVVEEEMQKTIVLPLQSKPTPVVPGRPTTTKSKKVTIASSSNGSIVSQTVIQVQSPPQQKSSSPDADGPDVKDLCSTLSASCSALNCYGKLKTEEECYKILAGPQPSIDDLISLQALLERQVNIRLSRRQRYELAFAAASANVQLHSTPWLADHLKKDSIVFSRSKTAIKTIEHNQPFLMQNFSRPAEDDGCMVDNNQALTQLGILLLELCFGTTLESSPSMEAIRTELGLPANLRSPRIDLMAALDWNRHVCDETGPQYAAAVNWCLKAGQTSIDAADDGWQAKVYENVVLPLQECCKALG